MMLLENGGLHWSEAFERGEDACVVVRIWQLRQGMGGETLFLGCLPHIRKEIIRLSSTYDLKPFASAM